MCDIVRLLDARSPGSGPLWKSSPYVKPPSAAPGGPSGRHLVRGKAEKHPKRTRLALHPAAGRLDCGGYTVEAGTRRRRCPIAGAMEATPGTGAETATTGPRSIMTSARASRARATCATSARPRTRRATAGVEGERQSLQEARAPSCGTPPVFPDRASDEAIFPRIIKDPRLRLPRLRERGRAEGRAWRHRRSRAPGYRHWVR